MGRTTWTIACLCLLAAPALALPDLGDPTVARADALSPRRADVQDLGLAPAGLVVDVNVGLDLRDRPALDAFLAQASDPSSPLFQQWLTQDQFNAVYAPTPAQEARVISWLQGAGFSITGRWDNRLLVGAEGDAQAVQRAFGVQLHTVLLDGATHYATLEPPRFPADISQFSTGVTGLDDLARMQPHASVGGDCCRFAPADLATFYDDSAGYSGSGQTVVIAGAYEWKSSDVTAYDNQWGLAALPTGTAQVCVGGTLGSGACGFDASNSVEISLDVDMVHATTPGAVIKNYMAKSTSLTDFQTMYNKVVSDNPGHSVTTSWGSCEAGMSSSTQTSNDNIFSNGNAKGQSWFAASGDNGSKDCGDSTVTVDHPANSPHVMGVGGTNAYCTGGMNTSHPACTGWKSETGWSGSGGGKSAIFSKPSWQTGCTVPADGKRDVPDVAAEASPSRYGNYVYFNGAWNVVGGTSGAAPQWGALFAELNQKKGGTGLGLPGTRLYAICGTSSFHDPTSGSNGNYSANTNYDQVTGLGTPEMKNLVSSY